MAYALSWQLPAATVDLWESRLAFCPDDVAVLWRWVGRDGVGSGGAPLREVIGVGTVPMLAYAFLQPGAVPVLVDGFFLLVLGRRVEARAGSLLFLLVFVSSALASSVTEMVIGGTGLRVGTSGGVAGVVGAYGLLALKARVLLLVPVVVVPVFVYVPASASVLAWVALQFPAVKQLLQAGGAEPLHWLAHVGGLLVGLLWAPVCALRKRRSS